MPQNPNLFLSVGKPVKDEYSRAVGKVASFALTPSGKFDAVFIEKGDGKFAKFSIEHLEFDGTEVTLISKLKSDANAFCDQIPLIWRKDQALKDLSEKKKISKELYEELHRTFDGALSQLKGEAQTLKEDIDKDIARCAEELKELAYALANLEIEHEIGQVSEENYNTAFVMVQDTLKRVHEEKNDLEMLRSRLSNITLGETSQTLSAEKTKIREEASEGFTSASTTPELPEPPVVVYVKEIGKAGI
jgi:hypothetical protein